MYMACKWIWMRRLGLLYFTISESGYNGQRGGVIRDRKSVVDGMSVDLEGERIIIKKMGAVYGLPVDLDAKTWAFILYHFGKRVQWATWRCNQIRGAPRSFVKFRDGS